MRSIETILKNFTQHPEPRAHDRRGRLVAPREGGSVALIQQPGSQLGKLLHERDVLGSVESFEGGAVGLLRIDLDQRAVKPLLEHGSPKRRQPIGAERMTVGKSVGLQGRTVHDTNASHPEALLGDHALLEPLRLPPAFHLPTDMGA